MMSTTPPPMTSPFTRTLFEADPETLEVMADPISLVHMVLSAWLPNPSEYLFYLQSSSFN